MSIGRLLVRGVVGGYFVGHGTQKLFGWFGGDGLDATAESFEQLGLRPGKPNALAAGLAEAGGGAALALGAATPVAASLLIATMLTAIRKVHLQHGPWLTNHGYEYNLVLIAALAGLAETGPGEFSLDSALGRERHGPGWALAALTSGVAGSFGAEILANRGAAPSSSNPPAGAPEDAEAEA